MTARSSGNPASPPDASRGAAAFFTGSVERDFVEAAYAAATPRIKAALAEEIEYLRGVLRGAGAVLELGCGTGRLLEALAECARSWVGIDLVASFLQRARVRRRLRAGTALVAADMARLPFAPGSFDVVLCGQSTLGLVGDARLPALQEAERVLRPGGRLLVNVYSESSVVPRIEWYTELHRRGLMAPLDWARSGSALLLAGDGFASACFTRDALAALLGQAGFAPSLEPLGEVYWAAQATKSPSFIGTGGERR